MSSLPYRAEYAKSGKSSCKGCKQLIDNQSLRLAIMVQSSFFDGLQPNWFHERCFFARTRLKSVDEIAHFQDLRWADQEEIRNRIESSINDPGLTKSDPNIKAKGSGKSKSTKRNANGCDPSLPSDIADYTIEYAKSSRSKCKVCEQMIDKGLVRISKKDYEGEVAKKYGPVERWHHVDCFIRAREELHFFAAGSVLPGFHALAPEDQKTLKTKLLPLKDAGEAPSPAKKPKVDNSGLMSAMKKQNEAMFAVRDELQNLPKKDLIALLEHNKQSVPEGADRILDRLADLMTFGSLGKCGKCNSGDIVFRSGIGYQCTGFITDWTKCEAVYDKPNRSTFKIPKSLKSAHPFLSSFKSKTQDRAFKKTEVSPVPTVSKVLNLPLAGLTFYLHKTTQDVADVKKKVADLGGKVSKNLDNTISAIISVASEISRKKPLKVIAAAKDLDIPVVKEDFLRLSEIVSRDDVVKSFKDNTCSSWGFDISTKLAYDTVDGKKSVYPSKSASSTSTKSIFKSDQTVKKLTLKDGLAVDPDSKLGKKAHVYRRSQDIYSVVLSLTDLQAQKNSFYKLQVLEADKGNRFWLFRSWGRIGTTIGGCKTEEYASLNEAISMFEHLFEEKSGNAWSNRNNFMKVPGKMMMLEVVHGYEKSSTEIKLDVNSKLPRPVQELMTLIFDIEAMKTTMLEFELDLNKMPLGKLSQKQISSAFSLLTELQALRQESSDRSLIIDRTNRFYTLVPHDFGIENPPILDNDELINQKITMLNSLMDIEIAYKLLESAGDCEGSPIDAHYEKLKANITVLDKTGEEFVAIKKYVKNTHAGTHRNYQLIIDEVFKVERSGESARYKAFAKLPNRKLLWHGSRVTNYAGILSQGLRIAPPEAPVTGYMFGKGIYFADMVSKSANYCMTSSKNSTGLLLLCEVALGNMEELMNAKDVTKLPKGKHSVKGVGGTEPDPSDAGITSTGAVIPFGKAKSSKVKNTSLLYNEYIVYDVNQVNIQYLVRMTFKFGKSTA